jgi:O-acetyl-ADP-ribose deacetylase (regulator of RNase III)
MIELTRGDIVKAEAEALVNTVNCVGFMGRGIALQFKRAFPANFQAYEVACRANEVQPGRMLVYPTGYLASPRYIINFPTKRHWRGKSRIEDIESGLRALVAEVRQLGIESIAVPPLGCGLGGLDWRDVRPRIERAFAEIPNVRVQLFEPAGAPPAAFENRSTEAPKMTPGRATLVGLTARYLAGLMDTSVSLLEIHKLMYFMQEAGEPLRLKYVKAPYGPYAENLRQVLARVEGHLLSGYADGGDAPDREMELVPGATADATAFLSDHPDTLRRFDRVADLVGGFETPYGMELLASVHWVATREGAASAEATRRLLYAWSDRKRRYTERQVQVAWDVLQSKGWLQTVPSAHDLQG